MLGSVVDAVVAVVVGVVAESDQTVVVAVALEV